MRTPPPRPLARRIIAVLDAKNPSQAREEYQAMDEDDIDDEEEMVGVNCPSANPGTQY